MASNGDKVKELLTQLPSFYSNYIEEQALINTLMDIYLKTGNMVTDIENTLYANSFLDTTELQRVIRSKTIELTNCLYSPLEIESAFTTYSGKSWFSESTTLLEKIAFLEVTNKYDELYIYDEFSTRMNVVHLEIAKDNTEVLTKYSNDDVYIKDNKLFAFNEVARPRLDHKSKKLVVKNLVYDTDKVAKRWGTLYPEITGSYIGKKEYKNLITSLHRDSSILLPDMKTVLDSANLYDNSVIYDRYTVKNLPGNKAFRLSTLGAFDFVFKLPPEYLEGIYYVPDDYSASTVDMNILIYREKLQNIYNLLNLIKPSYTKYLVEGTFEAFDTLATSTETVTFMFNGVEIHRRVFSLHDSYCVTPPTVDPDSYYGSAIYDYNAYNNDPIIPSLYDSAIYDTNTYYTPNYSLKVDSAEEEVTLNVIPL